MCNYSLRTAMKSESNSTDSEMHGGLLCPVHDAYIILGVTFMALVLVASVFGNILAIAAIYRTPRLHTYYFAFVSSLSVSDTLVGLSIIPFDIIYWVAFPVWPLGPIICNIWNTLFFMFLTASTLNLCAISIDRFTAIQFPYKYTGIITAVTVKTALVFIWAYSLVLATVIYLGLKLPPPGEYTFDLSENFILYLLIGNTILPFIVLLSLNMIIWNTARRQMKRIFTTDTQVEQGGNPRRHIVRELKVARMFMLVLLCFMLCWLPYLIVQFLLIVMDETCAIETADTIVCWLTYMPSAVNPFIYSFKNRQFRGAFWRFAKTVLPAKWYTRNNIVVDLNSLGLTESQL